MNKKYFHKSLPYNTAFKLYHSDVYCIFLHTRKYCQKLPLLYIISDTYMNHQGFYLISNMLRIVVFKMFYIANLIKSG